MRRDKQVMVMKILFLLLMIGLLCFQEYHAVDLNQYRSDFIEIEVKGEVKNPGVVQLDRHAKVKTALQHVKLTKEADLDAINQAQQLENGSVLVIPKKRSKACISINSAGLEELDELPGIGPAIAKRILEYRQSQSFSALTQLMEVKGIGDKLYQKLKEFICL